MTAAMVMWLSTVRADVTAALSWALTVIPADTGGGGGSGFVVDLLDLQWWQTLSVIIIGAGLSPAPWILGLAANKIEFVAPARERHKAAMEEQARHYEALLTLERARYAELYKSNEVNASAAEGHRARAEAVTDAALEMTQVVRANTHVIESLNEIAREATQP